MESEEEVSKTKIDPITLQFLYNFVEKNHALLLDVIDKLDQKIANLIATTAIVISILTYNALSGVFIVELFSIIGGLLVILSLIIGIKGYRPKDFSTNDAEKTWRDYFNWSYAEACEQVTSNLAKSFKDNIPVVENKAKVVKYQLMTLIIGILFIFISKSYMSFKFIWNIIFK